MLIKHRVEFCSIVVNTDSAYVHKGLTQWWKKWIANSFKKVAHIDMWVKLTSLKSLFEDYNVIRFQHVRAHTKIFQNDQADLLAKAGARM